MIEAASPTRRTTRQVRTPLAFSRAASVLALRGTTLPRRQPPSAVTTKLAPRSLMRSARDSGEKPPKTTVWGAPRRAQASMITATSGIMGM